LLLSLSARRDGQLALGRVGYAASDFPTRPFEERMGWRFSVLQNQRRDAGLRLLTALEREFDTAERTLQVVRPKGVWFELRPAGSDSVTALTWLAEPGYPAPTWALTSPGWPEGMSTGAPARPVLRAWWNPDQEPKVASRLDRGNDFDSIAELSGRKLFVDGDEVRVESVTAEEHVVGLAGGRRARQPCLVVRVAHAVDNPVNIRVRGVAHEGSALWQYGAAGRTTALYWPVPATAVASDLAAVELLSLRAFQREAERRGFTATLTDLQPPDAADEPPRQPLPLP
jgi:hypothetical protein